VPYHPAIGDLRAQLPRIALIAALLATALTLMSLSTQQAVLPSERWYRLSAQRVMEGDIAWHLGDALERVGQSAYLSLGDRPWLLKERGVAVWERSMLASRPNPAAAWRLGVIYGHRDYPEQASDMLTLAASMQESEASYYHALAEIYSADDLSEDQLLDKCRTIATREGWLTDIALEDCYTRLDATSALADVRARQQRRAFQYLGGFAVVAGTGGLLLIIGIVTIIVLLLRWGLRLPRTVARLPFSVPWTIIDAAEAVAVMLFVMALAAGLMAPAVRLVFGPRDIPQVVHSAMITAQYLLMASVTLAVIIYRLRGRSSRPWRVLGMRVRRGMSSLVGTGIAGYGVFLAILTLALMAIASLSGGGLPIAQTTEEIIGRAEGPVEIAIFFLLVCVAAPLVEETIFRGYLYGALRRVMSPRQAIVIGGAVFAAVHLNAQAFLVIGMIGALLCYLYERTRSLIPGMVAHALHNGLVFAVVMLQSL